MKGFILLSLLFVTVLGEKKINLEDIERDNLHAETKSDDGPDNKYNIKEGDHYQESTNLYEAQNSQGTTYADLQPVTGSKYIPDEYHQARNYLQSEAAYQQQTILSSPQQTQQPIQFYAEIVPESNPQATHETEQIVYQPELIVRNQIQTLQQKHSPEKLIKHDKEPLYMDVSTTQQLPYYSNVGVNKMNSKSQSQPLYHRLAVDMNQHSSLPVYSNDLHQNQFVSSGKFTYHIQPQYVTYTPKHPTHTQAVISKTPKTKMYNVHHQKMASAAQTHTAPVYAQSEKMHHQQKKVIYLTQQQMQYLPQIIYTEPKAVYSQTAPVYADIFSRLPNFVQDNSLNSHANQYSQNEQYYIPTAIDEQFVKIFQQPSIHGTRKERVKIPDEPSEHFVPPQVPAQKFKSAVTQLLPVSTESESYPMKSFTLSSEPKSLLDSYIPSYLIAAQDTAKYKERPIKLEGGFLPSKINFIQSHKKRKSE